MSRSLHDVCGASFPAASLGALADLRCQPGVLVHVTQQQAWLRWQPGDERVLAAVLAVPGVELYVRQGSSWSRLGSWLPSGPLPLDHGAQPLAQVVTPAPFLPVLSEERNASTVALHLIRTDHVQETTAISCNLAELLAWADRVPNARLAGMETAWCGDRVLLLGSRVAALRCGDRYWGDALLLPLGWRVEPALPPDAWREVLGLAQDEILLWREARVEVIPRSALQPLTRASLRWAQVKSDGRGANGRMDSTDAG